MVEQQGSIFSAVDLGSHVYPNVGAPVKLAESSE
jgi:hypothetical protein